MSENLPHVPPAHGENSGRKVRVAVVFGGASGEHSVSCATAASVLEALDPDRFEVIPIGITREGQWVHADVSVESLKGGRAEIAPREATAVMPPAGPGARELVLAGAGDAQSLGAVDVVLPLLHGPFGEDGTIQGLLEMAGVRYVGSGVLASALGMDKHFMKVALADAGLPVGPYVVATPRQWRTDPASVLDAVAALEFPVFVKPARGGSSLGISRAESLDGVASAIAAAQVYDPKVIIEQGLGGRELECGVLQGRGDDAPRTSPIGEVVFAATGAEFYDYETKYLATDGLEVVAPADVADEVSDELRAMAARAFEALGCEGLARVDFFWESGRGAFLNEINTMPGFTPFSMFPVVWQAAGMTYEELVTELVELALERPLGLR